MHVFLVFRHPPFLGGPWAPFSQYPIPWDLIKPHFMGNGILLWGLTYQTYMQQLETRIGVFAQGQILCISPNGLQAGHYRKWFSVIQNGGGGGRISQHLRSIHNLKKNVFTKWPLAVILENHFQSHFSPFQINAQFQFFLNFFHKMAAGGHFGKSLLIAFCFHKMADGGSFGWPKITFWW